LPKEVACLFAPLKPHFRYRHYLVLCWLVVAHLVPLHRDYDWLAGIG
jgi:hypothetical protein